VVYFKLENLSILPAKEEIKNKKQGPFMVLLLPKL
jgi:hypothetical protein